MTSEIREDSKLQLFTISFQPSTSIENSVDPESQFSEDKTVVYLPDNIIFNLNPHKDEIVDNTRLLAEQCETEIDEIADKDDEHFFNDTSDIVSKDATEDVENTIEDNDQNASKVFLDDDGNIYFFTDPENEKETQEQEQECDLLSKQIVDTSSENVNILQQYGFTFVEEDSEINDPDDELSNTSADVDIETLADVVQALKCKECNYTTLDTSLLIQHHQECHVNINKIILKDNNSNTEEKVTYICSKCSKGLASIQECREHMIKYHNFQSKVIQQSCSETIIQDDEESSISQNERTATIIDNELEDSHLNSIKDYWLQPKTTKEVRMRLCADKKNRCSIKNCLYRFKTSELMNYHKSCHIDDDGTRKDYQTSFMCVVCKSTFRNWPNCSMHLWRYHKMNIDLIKCPLCKQVYTHSAAKMVQHLGIHAKIARQAIECQKCHIIKEEIFESRDDTPRCRWYNEKRCKICQKVYANSKSLKIHIQAVHNKLKPFICNVCGHCAAKKHMLQLHMRQHTGEKPFTCDYFNCDYKTGDHNNLRKHRMKHTGEKPYACSFCSYSSIQSGALRSHYKSAHPDKPNPQCYQHKNDFV